MTRLSIVSLLLTLATFTAAGCSDNGGNNTGGAGQGGGAGGSGGGAGGSSGPDPDFMSVEPCTTEAMYVGSPTTIDFGLINSGFNYQPKCLKVATGTQVSFTTTTSDFAVHPLAPSTNRGTRPGNPITMTATGTSAMFTFPAKGFWAYFCSVHGTLDNGTFMAGVIWAD